MGIPIGPPQSVSAQITHYVQGSVRDLLFTSVNFAAVIGGSLIEVIVILVMAFYFMVDGHRIGDLAVQLFPPQHREKAHFVRAAVGQVLGSYIR
jgi:predicted PurR-regulated permease PerM